MQENEQQGLESQQPITMMMAPATASQSLEETLASAEKYVAAQDGIRKMCLRLTSTADWIDQGGTPYLEWDGACKIASAFRVSYKMGPFESEKDVDDKGLAFITYQCTLEVEWNGRSMPAIGTATSKDDFFAKRWVQVGDKKEHVTLPMSEIDLTNIKKKAMTNALNRGIKSLLGLSFTWEEIAEATGGRITRDTVAGVKYSKGSKGGGTESADDKDKKTEIRKMVLEMADNKEDAAKALLCEITTWKNKEGKVMAGRTHVDQLTEKQIPLVYGQVKARFEEFTKALQAGMKKPDESKAGGFGEGTPG